MWFETDSMSLDKSNLIFSKTDPIREAIGWIPARQQRVEQFSHTLTRKAREGITSFRRNSSNCFIDNNNKLEMSPLGHRERERGLDYNFLGMVKSGRGFKVA